MLGYEIKHGKHIAFRKNEQERFIRAKSLGNEYTEDSIKERILFHPPLRIEDNFTYDTSLGLIKNIKNYKTYINNPIYKQKVSISNIKKVSATYNYLVKHNIDSIEQLDFSLRKIKEEYKNVHDSLRGLEEKIDKDKELLHHLKRMDDYSKIYKQYQTSNKSEAFREKHRTEIMLYEASFRHVRLYKQTNPIPSISSLSKMIHKSEELKRDLSARVNQKKEKVKELETVKKNIQSIIKEDEPKRKQLFLQR